MCDCRPQASSALFFKYNEQLGPPYHVLLDTNFINFAIKNKLDIIKSMMDCLYAKCKFYFAICMCMYIIHCVAVPLYQFGCSSHFLVIFHNFYTIAYLMA